MSDRARQLRRDYPEGCRIALDTRSQATVKSVDDTGSIQCTCDTGETITVTEGFHKICTEDEAKVTLDWYGKHQIQTDAICPRCGAFMDGPVSRHALSRWADIMVCDKCGIIEALEKAGFKESRPMLKWHAIQVSMNGGNTWKR